MKIELNFEPQSRSSSKANAKFRTRLLETEKFDKACEFMNASVSVQLSSGTPPYSQIKTFYQKRISSYVIFLAEIVLS